LLLLAITALSYTSALNGGYIWDDDHYVTDNTNLTSIDGLARIWTEPLASPQYYPLVFTTFWLERQAWGLSPFGYHLVNVLLHACVAGLLYFILLRLGVPGAWLAALIFAVHPVNVETAAWISERKNVLSGVFYMLSAIALLKFYGLGGDARRQEDPDTKKLKPTNPPQRHRDAEKSNLPRGAASCSTSAHSPCPVHDQSLRWNLYFAGLLFFGCALLSKTVACTLPVALLLVLWWKRGRITRREVLSLVPFFVVGAIMGLMTAWLEKTHVGATGEDWSLGFADRFLVAGRALCFYTWKLIWPAHLYFNYERWVIDSGVWWQYLYPLAATIVLLALWAGRKRIGRGPLAAALFFVVSLAPALGFFDVFPFRYSYVADHFQYLASIGPISLFAASASWFVMKYHRQRTRTFTATAILIVLIFSVKTWTQGAIYADEMTLWTETLKSNPDSSLAHINIGLIMAEQGKYREALRHCDRAIEINPGRASFYSNRGIAHAGLGDFKQAITDYDRAIEIDPKQASFYSNQGIVYTKLGDYEHAIADFDRALAADPGNAHAFIMRGSAYADQGNKEQAISDYDRAIEINPKFAEAYYNRGNAYAAVNSQKRAISDYDQAIEISPEFADAYCNRGIVYYRLGEYRPAIEDLKRAAQLNNENARSFLRSIGIGW
jgi:tetratricopeptide (TPR) repeat protein